MPDTLSGVALVTGGGRGIGASIAREHDDVEDLIRRADEVVAQDLNAIRLRR